MGIGRNTRREFMRVLGAGTAALAAPPLETAAGTAPAADPPNVVIPLLRDPERGRTPYDTFLYYYMGQLQAVRAGRWKLHLPLASKRHGWHQPPYEERGQLYDLDSDVSEQVNLFDARPDVVSRLSALAAAAAADIGSAR